MASVLVPQAQPRKVTKGDSFQSKILPAVGAVVGGVVGGMATGGAGAIGGASGGMALGSALNQVAGIKGEHTEYVATPSSQGVQNTAAGRRMAQLEADPYTQLAQANRALEYAPKDVQDAYRKPLEEALIIAQKSKQSGGIA